MAEEELKPLELKDADSKPIHEWATLVTSEEARVTQVKLPLMITPPLTIVYQGRVFLHEGHLRYSEISVHWVSGPPKPRKPRGTVTIFLGQKNGDPPRI